MSSTIAAIEAAAAYQNVALALMAIIVVSVLVWENTKTKETDND